MDLRPNNTLYVNNLDDKLHKHELKRALYCLFSQHGRIIDIIALKTQKMRGQAFVIYQSLTSATSAFRVLQGFSFFQKVSIFLHQTSLLILRLLLFVCFDRKQKYIFAGCSRQVPCKTTGDILLHFLNHHSFYE